MAVAAVTTKTAVSTPPPAMPKTAGKKPPAGNGAKRATGSASVIPGGLPGDVDFWDWLTQFSADEWQNIIAYLWRAAPIIDRRAAGKATHVKKYATRFDLERIMQEEGSGQYRIDLCRTDPATTIQRRIAQHYFTILNLDYPPRLPHGDWLKDPDNAMWAWAEAALKKRANEAAAAAADPAVTGPTPAADPNTMFNTVLNGIRSLRGEQGDNSEIASTVLQIVQANQSQMVALMDPVKQLETLQTLLAAIRPDDTGAAAAAAASNNLIVDVLREDLRETRKELREMRAQQHNATPAPSFVETLLADIPKLQQVASALGFSRRAGSADAGPDWGSVAVQVIDKLADHVPAMIDLWRASKETPGTIGAGNWNLNRTAQPQTTTAPAPNVTTQPAAASTAATAAAGPELSEEERTRLQTILVKYGKLIEAVAPFLVDQYRAGLTGYDFRDWFKSRHGALVWNALKTEVGAEQLCALAQQHPHLKAALAPPERLLAFLQDFFTEDGEERSDDEPTAGATE